MLEKSKRRMASVTEERKWLAETIARAVMISELEEDLVPHEKAVETIESHSQADTEEWRRSVFAALVGLQAVEMKGYRFTNAGDASPQ